MDGRKIVAFCLLLALLYYLTVAVFSTFVFLFIVVVIAYLIMYIFAKPKHEGIVFPPMNRAERALRENQSNLFLSPEETASCVPQFMRKPFRYLNTYEEQDHYHNNPSSWPVPFTATTAIYEQKRRILPAEKRDVGKCYSCGC